MQLQTTNESREITGNRAVELTHDLAYHKTRIVNVFLYGAANAGDRGWVLIDAGVPGSANAIRQAAASRFGEGARPACIILTHGHFDHVGALRELAEEWRVPVYAHELELPYITGKSSYPPPDSTVGGGAMAGVAWAYPRGPIDIGDRARPLPDDQSVPHMPGWRWIATPGHTAGHVSFFRDRDAVLIAGDAFVTTKQESVFAVATQRPEIHGPPMYYTQDWEEAEKSVRRLAFLEPHLAATGHGVPLRGAAMRERLHILAQHFRDDAVPTRGRYVDNPVIADRAGVQYVPPRAPLPIATFLLAGAAAAVMIALFRRRSGRGTRSAEWPVQ